MLGYNVDDEGNVKKVKHLLELPKASTHLTLWKADLNEEGSFDEAIRSCDGVFHVASPMDFESKDPEVIRVLGVFSFALSCSIAVLVHNK
jgi:bifunctional dihydroflavonol 4-reductase/flavanone 4-reductase